MEKLKYFSFNNLHWQCRQFLLGEIADKAKPGMMMPSWVEPFASDMTDLPGNCKANLCRMIGVTAADTSYPDAGNAGNVSTQFVNVAFLSSLNMSLTAAGNVAMTWNNVTCHGDITASVTGTGVLSITQNNPLQLTGTADQNINLAAVGRVFDVVAQKNAGNVSLTGGSFALANDFTITIATGPSGSLTITGTASLAGNGHTVTVMNFDTTQTSGTVTVDTLTVSGNVTAGAGTVIDSITAVGGQDQTINVGELDNLVTVTFNKTGDVLLAGGNFELADNSVVKGDVTNYGTLDVPDGLLLKVKHYIDTPTGLLSGAGTLKTMGIKHKD